MRIVDYSPHWQEGVVALADRVFGKDFFEQPGELARDPNAAALVAHDDEDAVLGFALGRVLEQGGFADFVEHRLTDIPEDVAKADARGVLGVIQSVAVAREHRGEGIGGKLLLVLHDRIVGLGADELVVTFKRGPSSNEVARLMEKLGFAFWVRLDSYWKGRCDDGDFACADRTDTCNCHAEFYRKQVF